MRWQYFILPILVLSISIVSASLTLSPNPVTINTRVNQESSFQINLSNSFPFTIYNVQFSNLSGFNYPSITLQPNETKKIDFTLTRNQSYHSTINSKVSFTYVVDIPQDIQAYQVNISENGYQPAQLVIRQGDTVLWKNTDTLSHTVTSAIFDYTLLPNQTASRVFNELGIRDYQDLILFYSGSIEVINRTSQNQVHNPSYDLDWAVNLNVIINETILEIGSIENMYNVDAESYTEGSLKVKNIGNEIAEKVHLSSPSSWITFSENDFDLSSQAQKYVKYTIVPVIFNTNETGKNYSLSLKAKALNSVEYSESIIANIPYKSISEDLSTNEGFVKFFQKFCQQNPLLIICNNSIQEQVNQPKVIYRDPEIPINLTVTQVYELFKRVQRIEDSNARTDNKLKEVADMLGITVPQLQLLLNQSIIMQQNNEKSTNDKWDAVWIFGLCLVIAGAVATTFYYFRKYRSAKTITEGV